MTKLTGPEAFGDEDKQILERFRQFARKHVDDFKAARDRVRDLLAPSQPYLTGIAREDLLRHFLRRLLPQGIAVDSGVVYGFEKVPNSKQIDVLVWNSTQYPAVHRGEAFVILPPEAVVAAISVKTRASKSEYVDAIENLMSLVDLDLGFREPAQLPPMAKLALFYEAPPDSSGAQAWLTEGLHDQTLARSHLHDRLGQVLKEMDPFKPDRAHTWFVERVYPRLFVHLEGDPPASYFRGWGPPGLTADEAAKQPLHRQPYVYQQESRITTPLEKLAYHVLGEVFRALGTRGSSLVSAWGDFHPQYHFRVGDADELDERSGTAVIQEGDI